MDQTSLRNEIRQEGYAGRKKRTGIMAAGLGAAIAAAVILAFFYFFGLKNIPAVNMDGQITYEVIRGEGHPEERAGAPLLAGDRLIGRAVLHTLDKIEDAALGFFAGNSAVTVRIGGDVRFFSGGDSKEESRPAGDPFILVPISGDDWGRELEIDCLVTDGWMDAKLHGVRILPMAESALYPLIGKETKLVLFSAVFLTGLVLLALSFFSRRARSRFPDGLFLSLFLLFGSTFVLERSGFLHFLTVNGETLLRGALYSAFLAPAACFAYLSAAGMPEKKVRKRVYFIFSIAFLSALGAALVLKFSQGVQAAATLPYLRLMTAAASAYALLAELFGGPAEARNEDRQIKVGVTAAAVLLILDLITGNLYRFGAADILTSFIPDIDLIACAILVLAVFLLLHFYTKVEAAAVREDHAALISGLAYTDILTGIPNRHHCDRMLERIAGSMVPRTPPVDYTFFFMDVNSLHQINESIGYESGDELLRCVAEAVSDAMRGSGAAWTSGMLSGLMAGNPETGDCFFGRWGGGEFAACTFRSQSDAFETIFASRIAAINIEKRVPCDVSVSYGSCDLTSGSYERVREAIFTAEKAMRERKKQYHASHSPAGSFDEIEK